MTPAEQLAAVWFKWPVIVERLEGSGAYGDVFADPVEIPRTKISAKRKLVRAADGTEVISEARVSMPADTDPIPEGSRVTLPERFGGRVATVLADQVHDDGADLTPNFYSVDLT